MIIGPSWYANLQENRKAQELPDLPLSMLVFVPALQKQLVRGRTMGAVKR